MCRYVLYTCTMSLCTPINVTFTQAFEHWHVDFTIILSRVLLTRSSLFINYQ